MRHRMHIGTIVSDANDESKIYERWLYRSY